MYTIVYIYIYTLYNHTGICTCRLYDSMCFASRQKGDDLGWPWIRANIRQDSQDVNSAFHTLCGVFTCLLILSVYHGLSILRTVLIPFNFIKESCYICYHRSESSLADLWWGFVIWTVSPRKSLLHWIRRTNLVVRCSQVDTQTDSNWSLPVDQAFEAPVWDGHVTEGVPGVDFALAFGLSVHSEGPRISGSCWRAHWKLWRSFV